MALPSQIEHSVGSTHSFAAKRRQRNTGLIVAALVVVAAGGTYAVWSLKKTPTPAQAGTDTGSTVTPPAITPPEKKNEFVKGDAGVPSEPVRPTETPGVGQPPSNVPSLSMTGDPKPQANTPDGTKPNPVNVANPQANPEVKPKDKDAPNTSTTPTTPTNTLTPSISGSAVSEWISEGDRKFSSGDLLTARGLFSKALADSRTVASDRDSLRDKLSKISDELIFSNKVVAGDPLTETYTIAAGDSLIKIARKRDLATDWRLIQRINGLKDPGALKVGQKLKLVRGPFHAVVNKSAYRLDLYTGSPDDQETWTFVKSFKVGLGTENGTPTGTFVVKPASKLVNPHWTNPKTGEHFDASDPKNPIGEFWMGIEGVGASAVHKGFGLHGTIEPDSIGQQKSMGCVRLGDQDIALLYELLCEKISVVKIEP
ncbi:MAG: L,D-transpeptidase family protein [Phycisphaerales bacterium]